MISLIDPPSPFAPLAEWQAFLAEMESVEEDDPDVVKAIHEVKAVIDRVATSQI